MTIAFQETPTQTPEYLDYWPEFAPEDPAAIRVNQVVHALTSLALRPQTPLLAKINPDFVIEQAPPLQAEAWYHLLGPLNELNGAESDLSRAAEIMQSREVSGEEKQAELELDTAYLLSELARVSTKPDKRAAVLNNGLHKVQEIESNPTFGNRSAIYRLQVSILKNDLWQDAARLKYTGSLEPTPLKSDQYRAYERAFTKRELNAIDEFQNLVESGITEKNFGILFEWYFIMARRHETWKVENIDEVAVRGATSRENGAQWLATNGKSISAPRTANHDVVITSYRGNREPQVERIQLKSNTNATERVSRTSLVSVIDLHEVLKQNPNNNDIDKLTRQIMRDLSQFRTDYLNGS